MFLMASVTLILTACRSGCRGKGDEEEAKTSSINGNPERGRRRATVQDADEEDVDMDASNFAPGGDADYFAEEDDEGRFFGGGLTAKQKTILNTLDKVEKGASDDEVCVIAMGPTCLTTTKNRCY